jgi:membrane protein DedA with SNARE-associated domain
MRRIGSLRRDDDEQRPARPELCHDTDRPGSDPMSLLDGIAATAEQIVTGLGYVGLGLVMLVENVLPPIPSELVLPIVGLQVSAGQLLYWAAVAASTVGSVLGALVLYALGRFGGRALALRLPRVVGVTEERLARAEARFARRGEVIVLLARLVPGLRSAVSVPAGTLRMPVGRFVLMTAIGSLIWNAALIWLGTALASNWQSVVGAVSGVSTYVLAAATGVGILMVMLRKRRALRVSP